MHLIYHKVNLTEDRKTKFDSNSATATYKLVWTNFEGSLNKLNSTLSLNGTCQKHMENVLYNLAQGHLSSEWNSAK